MDMIPAKLKQDIPQSTFKQGDNGLIDGYVRGGDGIPYAAFIRIPDGTIELVPTYAVVALLPSDDIEYYTGNPVAER